VGGSSLERVALVPALRRPVENPVAADHELDSACSAGLAARAEHEVVDEQLTTAVESGCGSSVSIIVLFGERLLPPRSPRSMPVDLSSYARTLVHQYGLDQDDPLLTRTLGAAEVVIPPRSALVGQTAYSGMVAESGDLVVLGVQRKGQELAGETKLAVGDTLLLRGKLARPRRAPRRSR
jgi:hypothetical protein